MYISHKSNTIQQISDTEWNCRRRTKGLDKPEYWAWLESVTDADGVVDYSGETGYTMGECTDEDVSARLIELSDYISNELEGITYNIKYYASKRDAEEILDIDGNSHDPKQYVQSHFVGQDDTRDARLLAETDHLALADQTLSADMKTYRTKLRDLPSDQSSKTK